MEKKRKTESMQEKFAGIFQIVFCIYNVVSETC